MPSFPQRLSLRPINPADKGAGQRAESNQRPADGLKTNQHPPPLDLGLSRDLSPPPPTPISYISAFYNVLIIPRYSWELL